jgi:glycosyltransferase involved in cell wall biosynthesis
MLLCLLGVQSCYLSVMGSRISGVLDIITPGDNGALTNVGDGKGFAEAMKRYWKLWLFSSEEYHQLKRKIRENDVKNYDWDTIISEPEQMFTTSTFS